LFKLGIRKVTVEDICRESGVSKVTFYKYYENKTDLVLHLMRKSGDESMARYRQIMDSDLPFPEKIEQTIVMKTQFSGELSREFIEDIMINGGPEVVRFLQEQSVAAMQEIMRDYGAAQEKGLIRKDVNLGFMLWFINHMQDIMKDSAVSGMYAQPLDLIKELINFFFYGIMPRPSAHEDNR
jgi:AcrR family transcriptional regulator